jgi:glycerol 3-phosphatase-2
MTGTRVDDVDGGLAGCEIALTEAFDAALLDLDGVVYRGPIAVEHAAESIERARAGGMPAVFVTNNANRTPAAVADQLAALGIPAAAGDVMTSALAAAAMLRPELPSGSRVRAVGGPGLRQALADAGFEVVGSADDEPVAVVQGFAPTVGWEHLAEAVYAVRAGARFVATNLDLTIPTERGIAPGNGTLVNVVRMATGVEPASAGKPQPEIFVQAARRAGAERALVVGDRLDTDLAGAVAAGMPGLLVLTGVHDARAAVLAARHERPRFVGLDLRSLFEPHPAPRRLADGQWECDGARARVSASSADVADLGDDWRPVTRGAGATDDVVLTLDAWRALCCAAWEAADGGATVPELARLRVVDGQQDAGR